MSSIYETILQMSKSTGAGNGQFEMELKYGDILDKVKAKGFSEEDLNNCITQNEENDIWIRTANGSKLKWMMIE